MVVGMLSLLNRLGAVILLLLAVGLLIAPSAFHRIAEGGESTGRMHRWTGRCAAAAPETQDASGGSAAPTLAGHATAQRELTAVPDKRQDVSLNDPEMTDMESAVRANKRRMFSFF